MDLVITRVLITLFLLILTRHWGSSSSDVSNNVVMQRPDISIWIYWLYAIGKFHWVTQHDCKVFRNVINKAHYNIINFIPGRTTSSYSSVGATARCGLWPVEQYLSIFPYLSPTLSIFSLPAPEDLFLLLLSILSWVFLFVLSFPVLEWRSFWASYPPPFSPGDPANLSFAPLPILLYFLLYSTLLVIPGRT